MGDVITRLKVDSTEYDSKIKRAAEGLQHYADQCRKAGGTLQYVDDEAMAFARSLGRMETSAKSVRAKMLEFSEAIATLTVQYRRMSDEEKNGAYGKALQQSLTQLKARAGELKDAMSDTNEEVRHLASDTSFTDGVQLMTRTIGSCAAAITAWTGDSKEMSAVMKDLAKIGTTVAAVESLTKAFQKQNLVMLKNPYVLAAAGIAATAVAVSQLIKHAQDLTNVQRTLNEVQQKGRDNSAQEVTRIQSLNSILHDNTRSLDERKNALGQIQALVPAYHGALTTEGTLINDNTDALSDYITNLRRAATAQAAFDRMVEAQQRKLEKQLELEKAQKGLQSAQDNLHASTTTPVYGEGGGWSAVNNTIAVSRAESKVSSIQQDIQAIDKEIAALQNLVTAEDLVTTSTQKRTTAVSDNNAKIEQQLGILGQLKQEQTDLNNALNTAKTEEEIRNIVYQLARVQERIDRIRNSSKAGLIPYQTDTSMLAPQDSGKITLPEGTGKVDVAKMGNDAAAAWSNAAAAVSNVGSALQSIEDPAAKVTGVIMQAVAQVALGFAQAAASPATGAAGVFGWIAAATAGLATMVSTIATIKSVTKGYEYGGMVNGYMGKLPGSPYTGDNVVARLNMGEGVLPRQGIANASAMMNGGAAPVAVSVTGRISGRDILLAADADNRSRGGSRYAYSKPR